MGDNNSFVELQKNNRVYKLNGIYQCTEDTIEFRDRYGDYRRIFCEKVQWDIDSCPHLRNEVDYCDVCRNCLNRGERRLIFKSQQ
ncbi:MAG: hypothetical protein LBH74_09945 [Nitrososphaerota archaeon]|jgi:hypothetical protein|nr:hypothetical protein [Nitrososphaerota archaeon]